MNRKLRLAEFLLLCMSLGLCVAGGSPILRTAVYENQLIDSNTDDQTELENLAAFAKWGYQTSNWLFLILGLTGVLVAIAGLLKDEKTKQREAETDQTDPFDENDIVQNPDN